MSKQTMMIVMLAVAVLQPDPGNPRPVGDVTDLRLDIERRGVLVPLIVKPNGQVYTVADGHRRLKAAMAAGLMEVPCVVLRPDTTESEIREIQLVTQLQSQALTPYQVYAGCKRWLEEWDTATGKDLAKAISRSEGYVSMVLSLDKCIQRVKELAGAGKITLKEWYRLSKLSEQEQLKELEGKGQRTARLCMDMGGDVTVTIAGVDALEEIEETLVGLLKHIRKAKKDKIADPKTFAAVLKEKASHG